MGDVLLRAHAAGAARRPRAAATGRTPVARVAAAMGAELGWDAARVAAEADAFRVEAAAEGLLVA